MHALMKDLTRWTPLSGSLIVLIVMVLVITPVILSPFLPLNDYPFHLARIVILSDLGHPVYSEFYQQGSFLLPNMAMDMIAVPMAQFVGAETASRIFAILSLLSMLVGVMMLHKAAHNRFSPWPLLVVVLLFNGIFRFGFLNYIFGLGVAFFAAGLWLWMRPGFFRLFCAFVMSLLLILLHLSAFGVFAIIVGSIEIHAATIRWRTEGFKVSMRQLLLSAAPFLLTLVLFVFLSPTAGVAEDSVRYPSAFLSTKLFGALYSVLTGITWLDIVSLLSLAMVSSFLLLTGRIKVAPPLITALLMMTMAFMLAPASIMGAHFVDVRLVPAIALLWIAVIDVKAKHFNSNRLIAGLAILLAAITSAGITDQWRDFSKKISEIVDVFEKTETGATIFGATAQPFTSPVARTAERRAAWLPPLKHIASYAVLSGPKFVPMTFANPTMQPLNVADEYRNVKAFQGDSPRKTVSGPELEKFLLEIKGHLVSGSWPLLDNVYVFVMGYDRIEGSFNKAMLAGWAHIVESNDDHSLIKISLHGS